MLLTVLLPTRGHSGKSATLARWLARGDRVEAAKPGREAQLRTHFEFHGPALPIAALTRSLDANDADSALWLRCDPAYVIADAVTLRLLACGDMQLSADEVEEFARALKPLFGDAGFPLEAERPDRWYLRCSREARLPKFSDPADALGDDLSRHLPEGDNARQWRSLLNEAQIVLTQHPLNARRAQRGLAPVNSVWFWGAGVLPQWVRCGFSEIHTNDEIATALARLTKTSSETKGTPSPQPVARLVPLQATPALAPGARALSRARVGDSQDALLRPPTIKPLEERGHSGASMLFPSPSPQAGERVQGEGGSSLLSALKSQSAPSPQPVARLVPRQATPALAPGARALSSARVSDSQDAPLRPPTKEPLGERKNRVLLDLADQRDPTALETDWFAPIDALLAKRKLDALHLHFLDGERATYKPAHRWRFWRRVKP